MASASASRLPHGTIKASRPSLTTSRNPRMSEQTTGVSHAIDSSSVIPNDALVVGHAYIAACAKGTVAHDDQLSLPPLAADALERINECGETVARIEATEEEDGWHVATHAGRMWYVWIEEIDVDAVRNDGPICLEISIQRYRRRVRYCNRYVEHVQPPLKVLAAELVAE